MAGESTLESILNRLVKQQMVDAERAGMVSSFVSDKRRKQLYPL